MLVNEKHRSGVVKGNKTGLKLYISYLEDIEEAVTEYIKEMLDDSDIRTELLAKIASFFKAEWAKFKKDADGNYNIEDSVKTTALGYGDLKLFRFDKS